MASRAIEVELLNPDCALKSDGFSTSAIARLIDISRPTVDQIPLTALDTNRIAGSCN